MNIVTRPPANPYLVLLAAIVLPGSGQVMNRQPVRGLIFLFFILLLGGYTLQTAAPDVSIVGKLAGGLFVYAMAIFDAYKTARVRHAVWAATRRTA
ncbi:hypothetical protein DC366_14510 [Pelagivirga sediminicola]|uniref:Uncharacterized protein n=1 Tax=Pelagivirga sediminicola TaxID=2170575 RepID=A0A2T7G4I2_9RHOB|nr:hypothetical protein [Pelagivirga sediminicola]PVA09331.1 hypothetical protein DC366_14510 [Pelagivirga sediminicola]